MLVFFCPNKHHVLWGMIDLRPIYSPEMLLFVAMFLIYCNIFDFALQHCCSLCYFQYPFGLRYIPLDQHFVLVAINWTKQCSSSSGRAWSLLYSAHSTTLSFISGGIKNTKNNQTWKGFASGLSREMDSAFYWLWLSQWFRSALTFNIEDTALKK